MAGMYIYGISIGMEFEDIARILMSNVGNVIKDMTVSNVFTGDFGYGIIDENLFNYFDKLPFRALGKYKTTRDLEGNIIESPYATFLKAFPEFESDMIMFSRDRSSHLEEKIMKLEGMRDAYKFDSKYGRRLYNQLIDFVEEYVQQQHIIGRNKGFYDDIKTLSEGGQEFRKLGQMYSLNQGIKSKQEDFASQVDNITDVNADPDAVGSGVNLQKFAFDEDYRDGEILKYERVGKHTVNVLEAASTNPHTLSYIKALAVTESEIMSAFKYRSIKSLTKKASDLVSKKKRYRKGIEKGLQAFVGDKMRQMWMRNRNIEVMIPKGNKAIDTNGNMYTLTEDTPVKLYTDWGAATFRMWVENEVIPNLKAGKIGTGNVATSISNNAFIQDLDLDMYTRTISHNPTIIYTLPINMLPRTDSETSLLDRYRTAFESVATVSYQYPSTYYDGNGNLQTDTNKIPLKDLFTYYSMIATNWRLSEKSLIPLLDMFMNEGIREDFHKFEKNLDQSGVTLTDLDVTSEELIPYIAPFESPFVSKSANIWYKDKATQKYILREFVGKSQDDDFGDGSSSGYSTVSLSENARYLNTGYISPNKDTYQYTLDNKEVHIIDQSDETLAKAYVGQEVIPIPRAYMFTKENGKTVLNRSFLDSYILSNLEENKC